MAWVPINVREALFSRSLGFQRDAVLNDAPAVGPSPPDPELAAALKRAANALKAAGSDEAGRRVDYARLQDSEAYAALRGDLTPQLRSLDLSTLATRKQRLAFWINLYNVLILDATITFGVSRSVTEGRLGVVSFFRRAAYDIGGQRFSANDVEHGILRANRPHWAIPGPQLGPSDPRLAWRVTPLDPRIHFALNCASRSCPPIGVYGADRIDAQLDLAAASFIANDAVGSRPVAVFWTSGVASALGNSTIALGRDVGTAAAFSSELDGRRLTFRAEGDRTVVVKGNHYFPPDAIRHGCVVRVAGRARLPAAIGSLRQASSRRVPDRDRSRTGRSRLCALYCRNISGR